ncbi:MAG: hypothetical protein DMG21_16465 [Acidobacteria bacterium]|nr:MAG: hypothetical protein DMG21_16465 [Acidobacteriota bacterium]
MTANISKGRPVSDSPSGHLARVGVVCPRCHFQQFMDIELDRWPLEAPAATEIHKHLTEWIESHCPDHASWIAAVSKN